LRPRGRKQRKGVINLVTNANFERGKKIRAEAALQPMSAECPRRDADEGRESANHEKGAIHLISPSSMFKMISPADSAASTLKPPKAARGDNFLRALKQAHYN
jgi:hypothetical protein